MHFVECIGIIFKMTHRVAVCHYENNQRVACQLIAKRRLSVHLMPDAASSWWFQHVHDKKMQAENIHVYHREASQQASYMYNIICESILAMEP